MAPLSHNGNDRPLKLWIGCHTSSRFVSIQIIFTPFCSKLPIRCWHTGCNGAAKIFGASYHIGAYMTAQTSFDEEALPQIEALHHFALQLCRDEQNSKDLVQETVSGNKWGAYELILVSTSDFV